MSSVIRDKMIGKGEMVEDKFVWPLQLGDWTKLMCFKYFF